MMEHRRSLSRSFSFFFRSSAAASFFLNKSFLLLAFRLTVDGVGFFFFLVVEDKAPLPLVSKEKEKLFPTVKEKVKNKLLPSSIWQKSRHWDASDPPSGVAAIFTVYFWIRNIFWRAKMDMLTALLFQSIF